MKNLLRVSSLIIGFLLLANTCFAAIDPDTVWEWRNSATANMVNGGGFNSTAVGAGTDYSTQDAAQLALTDLANLSASTTLTSATGGFTALMVGNIIHIASGTNFIAGWYEITAYTDTNTVTIDRTANASLNASVGVGKVGGAMNVGGSLEDNFLEILIAGNIVYFKNSGSYTPSESMSAGTAAGTVALPIIFEGYQTTRGDNPTGFNRPTIAWGTLGFLSPNYSIIRNIIFTTTTTNGIYCPGTKLINVKATNSSTSSFPAMRSADFATNCEAISINDTAILDVDHVIGCYAHDSVTGISLTTDFSTAISNVVNNCSTTGILISASTVDETNIYGNTIYGNETPIGTGINFNGGTRHTILNNIIYGWATGISDVSVQGVNTSDYNDFYNNTANFSNVTQGDHDITTDPLLTNPAGTLIENCEDAWAEYTGTGVTATADDTTYKVGTYSARATCLASTGVERVMTEAISSTDMSAYGGIRFWAQSSVTLTAGQWQLLLDDTAACATPLKTLNLPAMTANTWYYIYLDGGDMSTATAIISIGLKQAVDIGAVSFYIDDVRAANNDFTVGSGSPVLATGLMVGSITGTTGSYKQNIGVDADDNTAASGGGGTWGFVN